VTGLRPRRRRRSALPRLKDQLEKFPVPNGVDVGGEVVRLPGWNLNPGFDRNGIEIVQAVRPAFGPRVYE